MEIGFTFFHSITQKKYWTIFLIKYVAFFAAEHFGIFVIKRKKHCAFLSFDVFFIVSFFLHCNKSTNRLIQGKTIL